jgi:hypothetical protein
MRRVVQGLLVLALTAGGGSVAQAEPYIAGYTDFPNALRVADEQQPKFIPGYTDFPNALRLAPAKSNPTAPILASDASASNFHWADAGVGAGVTATAAILLVGGLSVALRRRRRLAASS